MNRYVIILFACLVIIGINLLYAESYSEPVKPLWERLPSLDYQGLETFPTGNMWFDSLNVRFVGNWPFGSPEAVAVDTTRNLVFCGSGGGVYVLDVSNPVHPQELSDRIRTRGETRRLFYEDSSQILYIAAGLAGLDIWDVAIPDDPAYLGSCITRYALGVYTSGSYSYVAGVDSGLRVMDVSDPTDPIEVGSCSTPGYALGVSVSDTFAYVADADGGLRIISVSNPTNPYEVGCYSDSFLWFENLCVSGSYVYVADRFRGLLVLDISNPSNPFLVGSCYFDETRDVCVSEIYAYVTCCCYLFVVDISNPSNPVQAGSLWVEGDNPGISVSDTIAFIADGWIGLRVIDISNPPYPYPETCYELPYGASNVFVLGSYAFLSGSPGLRILDISDLSLPHEVAHWDSFYIYDMHVLSNYGYAAAGYEGFFVMDVWDPTFPIKVGSCPTDDSRGIFAIWPYAFVADANSGLHITDVSDPIIPYYTGHYDTPGYAHDVYVLDTLAYIADGYQGLRIINVSDVYNPQEIGFYDTRGTACDVFVSDSYAYVADRDSGFCIIDVSNPSNPQEIYHYIPSYWEFITAVHGFDQYVYFSVVNVFEFIGFRVYDISDPSNPQEVGYYLSPGSSQGIFVVDPYIFAAQGFCGLQIYENLLTGIEESNKVVSIPKFRLLRNPTRGDYIEVELHLAQNDNVGLELYNLLGQRVKTFSLNGLSSGKNTVRLQTKCLANGVYFLRLKSNSFNQTSKLILVR